MPSSASASAAPTIAASAPAAPLASPSPPPSPPPFPFGKPKHWRAFDQVDPFNGCRVAGYLHLEPRGRRYGALLLTAVDGVACRQLIWGTPKQLYPYVEDRYSDELQVRFPPLSHIKVYEKLDGTNILAYRYLAPEVRAAGETPEASRQTRTSASGKDSTLPTRGASTATPSGAATARAGGGGQEAGSSGRDTPTPGPGSDRGGEPEAGSVDWEACSPITAGGTREGAGLAPGRPSGLWLDPSADPAPRGWKPMVSYKTRRQPFMSAEFESLWRRILTAHPDLPDLIHRNRCNLSFELYGRENLHMILYEVDLSAALLFGVRSHVKAGPATEADEGSKADPSADVDRSGQEGFKGDDSPPEGLGSQIIAPDELDSGSLATPRLIEVLDGDSDLTAAYGRIRTWLDEHLSVESHEDTGAEEDLVQGLEGAVWYAYTDRGLLQYKCKPEYVQDAHFAAARGIPRHVVVATVRNAFEETDNPDYNLIVELLREEYPLEKIAKKELTIRKVLFEITQQQRVRAKVLEIYRESGLDFATQKNEVMRHIAATLLADAPRGSIKRKLLSKMAYVFLERLQKDKTKC